MKRSLHLNQIADAWAIWDPFISLHTLNKGAKVIADGETLNVSSPEFLITRTKFAKEHPELVEKFLKVYEKACVWQDANLDEAIKVYTSVKKDRCGDRKRSV